ncbi:hypothetical protein CYMTET_8651, partial [Cymbomonas tetramitiformis]
TFVRNKERGLTEEGLSSRMGQMKTAAGECLAYAQMEGPRVYAVDLSPDAAAISQLNVQRCNLTDDVQVLRGSWYEPLSNLEGRLGGIVSNPPYIPTGVIPTLQAEVQGHEPCLALDGGLGDALDSLTPIVLGAVEMLARGGFLALETGGQGQEKHIVAMLTATGAFERISIAEDFAGVPRFVTASRS